MAWAMTLTEFMEHKHHKVYWNGVDEPVIGVGFKIRNTKRVKEKLLNYGLNYNSVLSGADVRTNILDRLFHQDMQSAVSRAMKWVSNFHNLDDARKAALSYIAFTAEVGKLRKVAEMIENEEEWEKVAGQLRTTKWCRDKGMAGESICRILSEGEINNIGNDSGLRNIQSER